jgi:hypothetical protein
VPASCEAYIAERNRHPVQHYPGHRHTRVTHIVAIRTDSGWNRSAWHKPRLTSTLSLYGEMAAIIADRLDAMAHVRLLATDWRCQIAKRSSAASRPSKPWCPISAGATSTATAPPPCANQDRFVADLRVRLTHVLPKPPGE